MGRWLDRLARRAATRGVEPAAAQPAPGASRRDFLKKAAVVAGAAWTVPVMQTALAPAASASPGSMKSEPCTTPLADEGKLCGDGSRCHLGVCGSTGAICGSGANCISGVCSGGFCVVLPLGGTCAADANCEPGLTCGTTFKAPATSTVCGGLGAVCNPSLNTPTGNPACAAGVQCGSGGANANKCGGQNAPCATNNQCMSTQGQPCHPQQSKCKA